MGEFDGTTRRQALEELLAKHTDPTEHVPAHRFWSRPRTEKPLFGDRTVWHTCDFSEIEARTFRHYAPWHLRVRWFFSRVLGLSTFLMLLLHVAPVDACTITATKDGPVVKNNCATPLTPQQAADVVRPHSYVPPPVCTDCDGPHVAIAPYSGERWQTDFLRAAWYAAEMKRLDNYGGVNYAYRLPRAFRVFDHHRSVLGMPHFREGARALGADRGTQRRSHPRDDVAPRSSGHLRSGRH
jgi:hypothetical protein